MNYGGFVKKRKSEASENLAQSPLLYLSKEDIAIEKEGTSGNELFIHPS